MFILFFFLVIKQKMLRNLHSTCLFFLGKFLEIEITKNKLNLIQPKTSDIKYEIPEVPSNRKEL